jgi:hypothetical protein
MNEIMLTLQEVAKRWNVCPHTVKRMKFVPTVRFGKRLIRYRLADIEAFEESRKARS